jgi:hypothetical protein
MIELVLGSVLAFVVGLGLALAGGLITDRLRRDDRYHYRRRRSDK